MSSSGHHTGISLSDTPKAARAHRWPAATPLRASSQPLSTLCDSERWERGSPSITETGIPLTKGHVCSSQTFASGSTHHSEPQHLLSSGKSSAFPQSRDPAPTGHFYFLPLLCRDFSPHGGQRGPFKQTGAHAPLQEVSRLIVTIRTSPIRIPPRTCEAPHELAPGYHMDIIDACPRPTGLRPSWVGHPEHPPSPAGCPCSSLSDGIFLTCLRDWPRFVWVSARHHPHLR